MKPGEYPKPLLIYQGDTFLGPLFPVPSLAAYGGPSDLVGATVTAQLRAKETDAEPMATFTVERVDDVAPKVRLQLTPAQTASLVGKKGVWDIQVSKDGWVGTYLRGTVEIIKQVTR